MTCVSQKSSGIDLEAICRLLIQRKASREQKKDEGEYCQLATKKPSVGGGRVWQDP